MNQVRQFEKIAILLPLIVILVGCGIGGGDVGYVSGKVTLPDNKDSAGVLVRFVSGSSGVGATAIVNEDGTYSLMHKGHTGVPVGTYKISLTTYVPHMTDREIADLDSASPEEQRKIRAERNAGRTRVPKKYQKQNTSGLAYEIVSGSQTHDIKLTD